MADTSVKDCESSVKLPSGWKHKTIDGFGGKRSKKIVYFESPSGFLYKSPHSVLSHMRSSGQYNSEQVEEFEQQVAMFEERNNSKGQDRGKRKAVSDGNNQIEPEKNELKKAKTTDFRKVLSEMSDTPDIKSENEFHTNRTSERKMNNRLDTHKLPKLKNSSNASADSSQVKTESIKLEDINSRLKNYVEVFDDKFVPAGWRVLDIPHFMPQNEGITVIKRRYVSPKGISYSRSMACGALEKQNDKTNFEIMKQGLLSEGWIQNDQIPIPDRFFFQRRQAGQGVWFITPEWKIIKGMKKYKEYLVKYNYDEKYLQDIKIISMWKNDVKVKNEKDNSSLEIKESDAHEEHSSIDTSLPLDDRKERIANNTNVKDCSSDHESFPPGWKVFSAGDGILITSPTGRKFDSRRHALEFMLCSGEDAETLLRVWKTLSHEGWQEDDALPSGWRISTSTGISQFLTRDMKVLTEQNDVINHIKSDKSYSETDLNNFIQWTRKESQSSNSSSLELWISSENLPEGWKTTKSLPNKYLGDSGRIFPDKISALHFLISEHYKPEDIYKLWITLHEDGWIVDRNLPTGWRRKTENSTFAILSPMMQVFNNWNDLSDYISSSPELTPSEVSKLKQSSCDLKI